MSRNEFSKKPEFYLNYKETNAGLVLGLIIISFGFYIINWIYLKNKDFEKLDPNTPNSNRGAIIMMVIPFIWFFILMVFKNLFFDKNSLFLGIFEIVGWGLILFLVLKYILDFCNSFGKITQTFGFNWFIFYFLGILGIISIFYNFIWTIPLVIMLLIVVPMMQSELNSHFTRRSMKKKSNIFYS